MKAPLERCIDYYRWGRPVAIFPEEILSWKSKYETAPCISAQPTFKHMSLSSGDIVLLATDGLTDAPQVAAFSEEEKADLFLALAGAAVQSGPLDLSPWEHKLGHRFQERPSPDAGNAADWLLENLLFGRDDIRLARELTIELPQRGSRWQDDVTIVVAQV